MMLQIAIICFAVALLCQSSVTLLLLRWNRRLRKELEERSVESKEHPG
jgi:hypothetical protein